MGIRESLLNTITSVGSSDFVRIVTSAGASSKATLANVFKSFESGLGAKSSLTDSDYIRVVGSDNNLYKQSLESVASVVKATKAVSNLNNAITAGFYSFSSGASNSPNTVYSGTLMVIDSVVTTQLASVLNRLYVRRYVNNAWDAWTLIPTREEITTLNNLSMHSIQGNLSSFEGIPDGVSCGYLLNATGVPEGWYLCLKNTVASNSKELYLLGTGSKAIYTSQYRNSAWSTPSKFPTRAEVDTLNKKIYRNRVSTTSYAVPLDGWVSGNYHTFVMYGGTSSTNTFMYIGWIDSTGSTVALTPIKEDNGRTYTATFDASSKILTVTPSTTLWGGLTVITG